jgi:hypothetical protein
MSGSSRRREDLAQRLLIQLAHFGDRQPRHDPSRPGHLNRATAPAAMLSRTAVAVGQMSARSTWTELQDEITWTSSAEPRHIPVLLREG